MIKCQGCGVEKDPAVHEVYPYPESERICEGPVEPLFCLDVQPHVPADGYRLAVVCHHCFEKLDPDMWIGQGCWERLKAVVPFPDLPRYSEEKKAELHDLLFKEPGL